MKIETGGFKGQKKFVSLNIKVLILTFITATIPITIIGSMLYTKSVEIVIQKQNISSLNSINRISQQIESMMDNVGNLSLLLIQDDNVRALMLSQTANSSKVIQKKLDVTRMLTFYLGQKEYIESIYMMNDTVNLYNGQNSTRIYRIDAKTLQMSDQLKGGQLWMTDQIFIGFDKEVSNVISLVRNMNNTQNPRQKLGVIRINIVEKYLSKLYQDDYDAFGADTYLIDENNKIISSSNRAMLNQKCPEILSDGVLKLNISRISLFGKEQLVYYKNLTRVPWRLVSIIPMKNIQMESSMIMGILVIGIIASLILCFIVSVAVSRTVLNPLKELAKQMGKLKENNYNVNLVSKSNDEIGSLYHSFNEMSFKLNELINEVFIEKLHQEEAETKALLAQINPHFLYNNLDTAYWMSRMEKAEKTGKVVLALSNLYKICLHTNTQFISVKDEIEYIKSYIVIQRIRFEDSIQFYIDVSRDTEQLGTIRFVLQPLVENAINHGLLPTGRNGSITVKIYIDRDDLLFKVEDDGAGGNVNEIIDLLHDIQSTETKGFAIRNIHQRIQLRDGSRYGLEYFQNDVGGLTVIVRQPIIRFDHDKALMEKNINRLFQVSDKE